MAAITIPAHGAVRKGLSNFTIAKYSIASNANKYTGRIELSAAGTLKFSPASESSSEAEFENGDANEKSPQVFNGGDVELDVKGLNDQAAKLAFGLGESDTSGWTTYDDETIPPELGLGFVEMVQYGGMTAYRAILLHRVVFQTAELDLETLKKSINFKPQKLKATVMRDLTAKHGWRSDGHYYDSLPEAVTQLNTRMGTTS